MYTKPFIIQGVSPPKKTPLLRESMQDKKKEKNSSGIYFRFVSEKNAKNYEKAVFHKAYIKVERANNEDILFL